MLFVRDDLQCVAIPDLELTVAQADLKLRDLELCPQGLGLKVCTTMPRGTLDFYPNSSITCSDKTLNFLQPSFFFFFFFRILWGFIERVRKWAKHFLGFDLQMGSSVSLFRLPLHREVLFPS